MQSSMENAKLCLFYNIYIDLFLMDIFQNLGGCCGDVCSKHFQLGLAHECSLLDLGHELPLHCCMVTQNVWVISCIYLHPLWYVDMPIQNLVTICVFL